MNCQKFYESIKLKNIRRTNQTPVLSKHVNYCNVVPLLVVWGCSIFWTEMTDKQNSNFHKLVEQRLKTFIVYQNQSLVDRKKIQQIQRFKRSPPLPAEGITCMERREKGEKQVERPGPPTHKTS